MTAKDQKTETLSPVFAHGEAARPRVRAPEQSWTIWAGVVGAGLLGLMVFNGLSSGRQARAQAAATVQPVSPTAPAVATPVPPPPLAPIVVQQAPNPAPMVAPGVNPAEAYLRAPAMVIDFSPSTETAGAVQVAQSAAAVAPGQTTDGRDSADERFAARVVGNSGDTARATYMRDLGRTIPQGATIAAVLETAINSDLPGSVRAVVSRDVRSFDGSRILVPRGSKLIGQYKSAAAVGQTRAFVVWTRIITPQGVSIDVGSPATDRLGRGGLDGEVDTHFFRRFGAAILLSVVSAGSQALANSAAGSSNATFVIGSPSQANQVASVALEKQIGIPDTIKIAQGVPVQVSVARDLDFSGVVR